jgi:hypothetical protein
MALPPGQITRQVAIISNDAETKTRIVTIHATVQGEQSTGAAGITVAPARIDYGRTPVASIVGDATEINVTIPLGKSAANYTIVQQSDADVQAVFEAVRQDDKKLVYRYNIKWVGKPSVGEFAKVIDLSISGGTLDSVKVFHINLTGEALPTSTSQ